MPSVPRDLRYTKDHEWLAIGDDVSVSGVTAVAAEALGDVVYLDLPAVGATLRAGEPCGEVESTKAVSDLYAPADGVVVEVNADVVADPGLVNTEPYGRGWLLRLRITGTPDLLDAQAYAALVGADVEEPR
ncbi:glycine cleavage system protein GcvH [Dactylosporangium sucinum]|uniref:Glycine cleavage system H protein n=1 Tax=Dactylosporangium sucinum TaxID=1424081 RepID=A0A917SYM1_9ACTN|nr:glycine cleavage system protein GcvH [Dactylosporangium sucinum]GGM04621.1 glycine cleavage system H protein [Dactylosporangium sucinum]